MMRTNKRLHSSGRRPGYNALTRRDWKGHYYQNCTAGGRGDRSPPRDVDGRSTNSPAAVRFSALHGLFEEINGRVCLRGDKESVTEGKLHLLPRPQPQGRDEGGTRKDSKVPAVCPPGSRAQGGGCALEQRGTDRPRGVRAGHGGPRGMRAGHGGHAGLGRATGSHVG